MQRPTVIVVGPAPPPVNGMTAVTGAVLGSMGRDFDLVHVDTSDHRDIGNVGRFDVRNVVLALLHGTRFAVALLTRGASLVYVPLARNRVGVLRDALFLVPARLARRAVCVHFNARGFAEFVAGEPAWMRALVRFCLGGRARVIVLSDALRSEFAGLLPPDRVDVVPNGLADLGRGEPADRRAPVVLHLTTLWSEKGTFELIDAIPSVLARVPGARFVLAGPWFREDERARAEELLADRGLGDAVKLPGPVFGDAKAELLRSAALVALPSWTEGQPFVLLEAAAAATPAVASWVGGIPSVVEDGSTGLLVKPRDPEALADGIARLLDDAEMRGRFGEAARDRFEREFTLEVFAERLAGSWRRALEVSA